VNIAAGQATRRQCSHAFKRLATGERGVELDRQRNGLEANMIRDLLVAALIVVIAVVLGIAVHPLLLFLLVLAAIWLFTRRTAW
jgi:Flp pilus assembly protein TadB